MLALLAAKIINLVIVIMLHELLCIGYAINDFCFRLSLDDGSSAELYDIVQACVVLRLYASSLSLTSAEDVDNALPSRQMLLRVVCVGRELHFYWYLVSLYV